MGCHCLLQSSSIRFIQFLSFTVPIFASNVSLVSLIFSKRSLVFSIVFLYLFALITKEGRDITLPTKVRLVKAMVFPVVMYGCENWTIKEAEHQRIDAFELWCWKRLLRVPWTAGTLNQSILKEISPEYSLERLMLKLKLQYFGHLM